MLCGSVWCVLFGLLNCVSGQVFENNNVQTQLQAFGAARVRAGVSSDVKALAELLASGATVDAILAEIRKRLPGGEDMTLEEFKGAILEIGKSLNRTNNSKSGAASISKSAGHNSTWEWAVASQHSENVGVSMSKAILNGGSLEESIESRGAKTNSIEPAGRSIFDGASWEWGVASREPENEDVPSAESIVKNAGWGWAANGRGGEASKGHESDEHNFGNSKPSAVQWSKLSNVDAASILAITDKKEQRKAFVKNIGHKEPLSLQEVDQLIGLLATTGKTEKKTLDQVLDIADDKMRLKEFLALIPHDMPLSIGEATLLLELATNKDQRRLSLNSQKPDLLSDHAKNLELLPSSHGSSGLEKGRDVKQHLSEVAELLLGISDKKARRAAFAEAIPHSEPLTIGQLDSLILAYERELMKPVPSRYPSFVDILEISDSAERRQAFAAGFPHQDVKLNDDWDVMIEQARRRGGGSKKRVTSDQLGALTDVLVSSKLGAIGNSEESWSDLFQELSKISDPMQRRRMFVESFPHKEPPTISEIDKTIEGNLRPRATVLAIDQILELSDVSERRSQLANAIPHRSIVANEVWDKLVASEIASRKK